MECKNCGKIFEDKTSLMCPTCDKAWQDGYHDGMRVLREDINKKINSLLHLARIKLAGKL